MSKLPKVSVIVLAGLAMAQLIGPVGVADLVLRGAFAEESAEPIPAELARRLSPGGFRDVTWSDPFPGKWKTVDVTTRGIKPGEGDVTGKLRELLNGLREPTIVYFPPGTYRFTGITMREGNFIIKGAGPDQTIFRPPQDGKFFELLGKGGWYEWNDRGKPFLPRQVTADVPAGATVVPIAGPAGLAVDDTVIVVENLDRWSYPAAKRGRGGIFVIAKVEPDQITLNLPLTLGLEKVGPDEKNAFVAKIDPVQNVGFEGFSVVMPEQRGRKGPILHIKRSRNVYVRNVETFNPYGHHVMVAYSHRVVVEGCLFDEAKEKGGGGYGYGVNLRDLTTLCKIENCVLKDLRHFLATEVGANYGIYAYNYSIDRLRDLGNSPNASKEKFRNQKWLRTKAMNGVTTGFVTADTVAHGNFPHHILLEGNVFYNACVDVSHNINGPHFLFRNKALGQPKYYGWWQESCGITIMGENDDQVVVGNVLANDSKILLHKHRAPRLPENTLIAGNVVKGETDWGPMPADTKLPRSLYLKEKPSFWPEDLAWPPFGPDVPESGQNKLPAQLRYEARTASH